MRLAAIAAGFLVWLAFPSEALGDTGPWSTPIKLSDDRVGGWFPDVAADDRGNVHVVWAADAMEPMGRIRKDDADRPPGSVAGSQENLAIPMAALYYSGWDGKSWSRPNDIGLAPPGSALRSSLAVDPTGRLHVVRLGLGVLDARSANQDRLWYAAADGARASSVSSWSTARQVTRSDRGYYSDIAVDSRGVIHVVWTESSEGNWGIYYSRSTDGGAKWSDRVALDGGNFVWWYRLDLEVDKEDRLHVAWELTDPVHLGWTRGVAYARSTDGGGTWARSVFPPDLPSYPAYSDRGPGPQQPSLGVDGAGNALLVFRDPLTSQVKFQVSSDGANWSEPEPIPGVRVGVARPYDTYDMATDSAGRVHLAMVGYPDNSEVMSLLHAEWDGRAWLKPSVVTGSPPYPEYPRLAVGGGNRLHLVWFGGDRPSIDRSYVGVWYSTAQSNAPVTPLRGSPDVGSGQPKSNSGVRAAPTSVLAQPSARSGSAALAQEDASFPRAGTGASRSAQVPPALAGAGFAFLAIVVALAARSPLSNSLDTRILRYLRPRNKETEP